jgi:hypothetical protein
MPGRALAQSIIPSRTTKFLSPSGARFSHPSVPLVLVPAMNPSNSSPELSRRSFLRTSALAATTPLFAGLLRADETGTNTPLVAYVGTYSSPLHNPKSTQVDLPPGNGRGIHLFQVNRAAGLLTPLGTYEQPSSPSCLALNAAGTHLYSGNETDRFEGGTSGSVSAFAINRADGKLKLLNTVNSGGAGPAHLSIHPSGRFVLVANYLADRSRSCPFCPMAASARPRISRRTRGPSVLKKPPTRLRGVSRSAGTIKRTRT